MVTIALRPIVVRASRLALERTGVDRSIHVTLSERVRRVSRRVPSRTGAHLSFPSPLKVGATNYSNELHDGRDRQKEARK